jgi:hypothetical protein
MSADWTPFCRNTSWTVLRSSWRYDVENSGSEAADILMYSLDFTLNAVRAKNDSDCPYTQS